MCKVNVVGLVPLLPGVDLTKVENLSRLDPAKVGGLKAFRITPTSTDIIVSEDVKVAVEKGNFNHIVFKAI